MVMQFLLQWRFIINHRGGRDTLGTSLAVKTTQNLICRVSAAVYTYLLINSYNPRQKPNGLLMCFRSDYIHTAVYRLFLVFW